MRFLLEDESPRDLFVAPLSLRDLTKQHKLKNYLINIKNKYLEAIKTLAEYKRIPLSKLYKEYKQKEKDVSNKNLEDQYRAWIYNIWKIWREIDKLKKEKNQSNEPLSMDARKAQYFNLSDEAKLKLVTKTLKDTAIDATQFAYYIVEDDEVYFAEHPLFKVAFKLPVSIGEFTEEAIAAIANNSEYAKLLVKAKWLSDPTLFKDTDENVAFKIKALIIAAKNDISIDAFKSKNGNWLPIDKFKQMASELLRGFTHNVGLMTNYEFLVKKNALGNWMKVSDASVNKINMIQFLQNIALPKSKWGGVYKSKLESTIEKAIKTNDDIIYNMISNYLEQPRSYNNIEEVYNDLILQLAQNKETGIANALNIPLDDKDSGVEDKQRKEKLINQLQTGSLQLPKSEASQLINSAYDAKLSDDDIIAKAIKLKTTQGVVWSS